jgi:hypothetical protein
MESGIIGYILDFVAGFWVIQSIILRSKRTIRSETQTYWDANPFLYESQLKAFWDGWLGIVLLFIGLLFHLYHFSVSVCKGITIIGVIVLASVIFRIIIAAYILKAVRKQHPNYDAAKEQIDADLTNNSS